MVHLPASSMPHAGPESLLRTIRVLTVFLVVALFGVAPAVVWAAAEPTPEEHPSCRPDPELSEAFETLQWDDECDYLDPCGGELVARAEALLEEHPDAVHLHRTYQNLIRAWSHPDSAEAAERMAERYQKRVEEQPDDALGHYLLGRSLYGDPEAVVSMERAVALDPTFPWGQLGLATMWIRGEDEIEPSRIQGALATFEEACPRNLHVLQQSRSIDDEDFWRPRLPRYREILRSSHEPEDFIRYRALWSLDFKLADFSEHDAIRQQVRDDLDHLASLQRMDDEVWWSTRKHGTEMLGDPEALTTLEDAQVAQLPCSSTAVKRRLEPWNFGPEETPDEEKLRASLAESDGWLELCPNELRTGLLRFTHFRLLLDQADVDDDRILEEVDRVLGTWEVNKGRARMQASPYIQAAILLLDRGLDIDRAAELIDLEADQVGDHNFVSESIPETIRERIVQGRLSTSIGLDGQRLRVALARQDFERAREHLASAETTLAELRERVDGDASKTVQSEARILGDRGRLAEAEGRRLDALLLYRRAESLDPQDDPTFVSERAASLWQELGGSEEGRRLLEADAPEIEVAAHSRWEDHDQPMPEFEVADLAGGTWRRDDLLGTTTLVNFWATWCAPCRTELPHLKDLSDRLAEHEDVQVVTFNLDDNPGLIQPFVDSESLELPVILASPARDALDVPGLPTNWIVDREGVIRHRQTGFSPSEAETWVDETYELMLEMTDTPAGDD